MRSNSVIALGFFDSIHCGHRFLLNEGRKLSQKYGTDLGVITFDDNFLSNLPNGKKNCKEVFLLDERLSILREMGINNVEIIDTDNGFLSKTAEQFAEYVSSFMPKAIVCGADYTFGKFASGNASFLKAFFAKRYVEVKIVDLLIESGKKTSTSDIKNLLSGGNIIEANRLMGHNYFLDGIVSEGRHVGNELGIPTANIICTDKKLLPLCGVYSTLVTVDGCKYKALTNVGTHPTFDDYHFNTETFILGFNGDVYGKILRVEFLDRIRGIFKFCNSDELIAQIRKDINFVNGERND